MPATKNHQDAGMTLRSSKSDISEKESTEKLVTTVDGGKGDKTVPENESIAKIVTPMKRSVAEFSVIVCSDGRVPQLFINKEDADDAVQSLEYSYSKESFHTLDEAIAYYTMKVQEGTLASCVDNNVKPAAVDAAVASVGATPGSGKGKLISSVGEATGAKKIKQSEGVARKQGAVKLAKQSDGVARKQYAGRKGDNKSDRLEALRKTLGERSTKGMDTIRISFVQPTFKSDVVFSLDVMICAGTPFWQFKAKIFPLVVQSVVGLIPNFNADVWSSLEYGLARKEPFGPNECRKRDGWDVETVWGIFPINSLTGYACDELKGFGIMFKKLFTEALFQEFYLESIAVEQQKLAELIDRNSDKDIWKVIEKASIMVKEKSSLDSLFCDETIVAIMERITEGKDPSNWSAEERSFAYHNGTIPPGVHNM